MPLEPGAGGRRHRRPADVAQARRPGQEGQHRGRRARRGTAGPDRRHLRPPYRCLRARLPDRRRDGVRRDRRPDHVARARQRHVVRLTLGPDRRRAAASYGRLAESCGSRRSRAIPRSRVGPIDPVGISSLRESSAYVLSGPQRARPSVSMTGNSADPRRSPRGADDAQLRDRPLHDVEPARSAAPRPAGRRRRPRRHAGGAREAAFAAVRHGSQARVRP